MNVILATHAIVASLKETPCQKIDVHWCWPHSFSFCHDFAAFPFAWSNSEFAKVVRCNQTATLWIAKGKPDNTFSSKSEARLSMVAASQCDCTCLFPFAVLPQILLPWAFKIWFLTSLDAPPIMRILQFSRQGQANNARGSWGLAGEALKHVEALDTLKSCEITTWSLRAWMLLVSAGWRPISHRWSYDASESQGAGLGSQQSPSLPVQGVRIDSEVTRTSLHIVDSNLLLLMCWDVKNKAKGKEASSVLDSRPARTLLDMLEDKSNRPKIAVRTRRTKKDEQDELQICSNMDDKEIYWPWW